MNTVIRVLDDGRSQVGWTRNGIDWTPTGDPFDKPRDAIDYATELEGFGPRTSRPRLDDSAVPLGSTPSRDERAEPEALVSSPDASPRSCVVCGRDLPPGSRPQRRTDTDRCRRALARQGDPLRSAACAAAHGANVRAKSYGIPGRLTTDDIVALWDRQPECLECTAGRGVDHIVAMSNGGANEPSNLQNLCLSCNRRKAFAEGPNAARPGRFKRRVARNADESLSQFRPLLGRLSRFHPPAQLTNTLRRLREAIDPTRSPRAQPERLALPGF